MARSARRVGLSRSVSELGPWTPTPLASGDSFPPLKRRDRQRHAATPASASHSRIFCLGMAPTFIEVIWPSLNSIMVGMPRTP